VGGDCVFDPGGRLREIKRTEFSGALTGARSKKNQLQRWENEGKKEKPEKMWNGHGCLIRGRKRAASQRGGFHQSPSGKAPRRAGKPPEARVEQGGAYVKRRRGAF